MKVSNASKILAIAAAILELICSTPMAVADDDMTPLQKAAMSGQTQQMEKALAAGESANELTNVHLFLSTTVLVNGPGFHPDVIGVLKKHGFSWKALNKAGYTAPVLGLIGASQSDHVFTQEEENFYHANLFRFHKTTAKHRKHFMPAPIPRP